MNEANNVLTIKTVEIQPIRNMITAIKDILTDATITFTKEGMKIINFDKTHTILVDIFLEAKKFEKYVCHPEKIIVCANTLHLFKVISTMSNDDILSMYIENSDYHDGIVSHLGLQYDNGEIKQCYSQKLRLIEPDTDELVVPDVEYSTVINLPTADFQKIIQHKNFRAVYGDLDLSAELSLSRAPKGYEEDNPAIKYIKLKSFIATHTIADSTLTDKSLVKQITQSFKALHPLLNFINAALEI